METFIFCAVFDITWYDEAAKNFPQKTSFFSIYSLLVLMINKGEVI